MNILISPWSTKLRNGKQNPKNYPWWQELVNGLYVNEHSFTQIGATGEERLPGAERFIVGAPMVELRLLTLQHDLWISVDNFFPHFVNCEVGGKPGVVLWSRSDPLIFGYPQNLNLLKGRWYLRQYQFDSWEADEYRADAFLEPSAVIAAINRRFAPMPPPLATGVANARIQCP